MAGGVRGKNWAACGVHMERMWLSIVAMHMSFAWKGLRGLLWWTNLKLELLNTTVVGAECCLNLAEVDRLSIWK